MLLQVARLNATQLEHRQLMPQTLKRSVSVHDSLQYEIVNHYTNNIHKALY